MLRFIAFVVGLFQALPWWGALAVLGALVVGLLLLAKLALRRMMHDITREIVDRGLPLAGAAVTVHAVEPAAAPTGPSPLEAGWEQDESYDPEYDDDWNDEGTEFCWIDATIAPQNPVAPWEPGMISLVPAEFEPDEALEVPGLIGVPHTIEILQEGRFVPYGNELVCGRHRLRMLFAVPQDLHEARFAYQFTYFGSVSLQSGVAAR
jgi:hypothetical protein